MNGYSHAYYKNILTRTHTHSNTHTLKHKHTHYTHTHTCECQQFFHSVPPSYVAPPSSCVAPPSSYVAPPSSYVAPPSCAAPPSSCAAPPSCISTLPLTDEHIHRLAGIHSRSASSPCPVSLHTEKYPRSLQTTKYTRRQVITITAQATPTLPLTSPCLMRIILRG